MVEVSDSPAPLSDLPASLSFPMDLVRSSADFPRSLSLSAVFFSSSKSFLPSSLSITLFPSSLLASFSSASSFILGVPTPLRTSTEALLEMVLADPGLDDLAESGCKVTVPGLDIFPEVGLELGAVDFGEVGLELGA